MGDKEEIVIKTWENEKEERLKRENEEQEDVGGGEEAQEGDKGKSSIKFKVAPRDGATLTKYHH